MTNETSQAQWVESDGVSNLPTAVGCYEVRPVDKAWEENKNWGWIAYFDGNNFFCCASNFNKDQAMVYAKRKSENEFGRFVNAWRDYQGLMSKPAQVAKKSGMGHADPMTGFTVAAIMASDEPGIQSAAYRAKYDANQALATLVNGVECNPAELAAFLDSKRPKPIPNNTPRGIMTVWNEAADHRFGMWNGNFAD